MDEEIEIISELLINAKDSLKHYKKLVVELERELVEALEWSVVV